MEKRKIILLIELSLIILLCLFIGPANSGSILLGDVNFIDEGQFGAWAYHMTQGSHMYKDIFITYGPLYVYPLFVLFKIFGPYVILIRIYQSIGTIIGVICLWIISRKLKFSTIGKCLLIILAILLPVMQIRQASGFLVILCFLKTIESKSRVWAVIAGSFIAISFLVSPDIGIFSFLLVGAGSIYTSFKKSEFVKILPFLYFPILVVFYLFFLWSNAEGWFNDYLQVTQDVLLTFSGMQVPNGQNFPIFFNLMPHSLNMKTWFVFLFSKDIVAYWLAFFYEIVFLYITVHIFLKKSIKYGDTFRLIAVYGFLLYTILLTRSGIGHFFFVLSPAILLLLYFVEMQISSSKKSIFTYLVIFISLLFIARLILINRIPILSMLTPGRYISKNKIDFISVSTQQEKDIVSILEYTEKNTTRNDYVFFLSDEPMLYMLTQRKNSTRYDLPFIANTLDKRMELVNDIIRNKPKFIFYNTSTWAIDGIDNFTRIPEMKEVIKENYEKVSNVGDELAYRLKR